MLASGRGRSLLVLFTEGEDNLSWLDATQVRRVLLESNLLVKREGLHGLEVKLVRRTGKVHCRKAYFVGPPAAPKETP
jgi:hypothetical protein